MAKAELVNGSTVRLERDCECLTHRNPHWVHMDSLRKKRNIAAVTPLCQGQISNVFDACSLMEWFAKAERIRLQEKLGEMEKRGIVRLIHEPGDECGACG